MIPPKINQVGKSRGAQDLKFKSANVERVAHGGGLHSATPRRFYGASNARNVRGRFKSGDNISLTSDRNPVRPMLVKFIDFNVAMQPPTFLSIAAL